MKNKRPINILIVAALLLTFYACMPERKLARDFIASPQKISIQVLAPESIYKYNHKGENVKGFNKMTEPQQDSALYASSRYIRLVDDSAYLERYVNLFIDELRRLGFEVFLENSIDTFLNSQPQAYLVNMAQVQLDEYTLPIEDSVPVGDSMYYKRFNLNAVDASTWFEINKLNVP
ncbi:MAG TPA: hypothetical protein VLR52_01215, partial [Bacteroidales bacterium]|nr:hypothetical protein [Bacteroidales bacterium]